MGYDDIYDMGKNDTIFELYQLTPPYLFIPETMPRVYKRKTERGGKPLDVLQRAETAFRVSGKLRETARDFDIDPNTLRRYIIKVKENPGRVVETGYTRLSQERCILNPDMESDLATHIKDLADQFHGLSIEKCRELAFEYSKRNAVQIPANWEKDKKAGKDWFMAFRKRHNLANRAAEATSLARATAFNRHTVGKFYDNLAAVMDKHMFQPQDIYNLDETGCTTVQNPGKVVASKGKKQVGSVTSAERGELVTLEYAISAAGNIVPPMFVFPRVNFRDHFLNGAPPGAIGSAARSGWMNEELYLEYLRHFINHTRCSKDRPVLLILDNVESHISLEAIDLGRENGVVMLTLPPHTSHRLQPLDCSVYGPFKTAYNVAMDSWIRSNPGKTVTIYDIPSIVAEAQINAMTHRNILSGFRSTGIYPFNRTLFTDNDFASASVTDRPEPMAAAEELVDVTPPTIHPEDHFEQPLTQEPNNAIESMASTSSSGLQDTESLVASPEHMDLGDRYVSPAAIIPFPKAPARKTKGGRKKGSTKILTSTPIRNEIAESKKEKRKQETVEKSTKKQLFEQKRRNFEMDDDESSSTSYEEMELCDTDEDLESDDELMEGDFVVVKLQGSKGQPMHYIARVDVIDDNELEGVFLKKVSSHPNRVGKPAFVIDLDDEASFPREDCVKKLPTPTSLTGSLRKSNQLVFPCDLSKWELKC
ncbi:uncharacterized protein LOC135462656 [Liolophura sinensis]|uniref:uncharacterized protein LOC135462656 n=1 Tax=Liolophura sinensis TaxID=3198878 RepID=UPI00315933F3